MEKRKVKIGVMGGRRGSFVFGAEKVYPEQMEVVAFCENDPEVVEKLREDGTLPEHTAVFDDFDQFIKVEMDAMVLCNYFCEHVEYAIEAMKRGIMVMSETTAAPSLGKCLELVEACEKYNGKYMLGANCVFFRSVQQMRKLADEKKAGEVFYADAEYIHPTEKTDIIDGDGQVVKGFPKIDPNNLHWRQSNPKCYYNMHDMGPLMYIANTMPKRVMAKAVLKEFEGANLTGITKSYCITEMDNGAVFNYSGVVGVGCPSKWYRVAFETGSVESVRYDPDLVQVIETINHVPINTITPTWSSCGAVTPEEEALYFTDTEKMGHGGIDEVMMLHFIKFVRGEEEPFFDVYKAVALSATGIMAYYSMLLDGKQLDIPDFKNKEDRERVRNDFRNPFGKTVDEITLPLHIGDKFEM